MTKAAFARTAAVGFFFALLVGSADEARADRCAHVRALLRRGVGIADVAKKTGLPASFVRSCLRDPRGFGAAGSPPTGASGPPPARAAGPPPLRAGGPPPAGAAGSPPLGAAGPPPENAAGFPGP